MKKTTYSFSRFAFGLLGFPGVIGYIEGTEVQILKPTKDAEVYFNRKKITP